MSENNPVRSFNFEGNTFDIPTNEVETFLKDVPGAKEIRSFTLGKDTLDIPLDKVNEFISDVPGAKPLHQYEENNPNEKGFLRRLGGTVGNELQAGLNQLDSWIIDTPGFIYDLAGAPFRAVGLNVPKSEDINTPLDKISDYYKNNARLYEEKVKEINPGREQGIVGAFDNGDIQGGILNLAGSIAKSTPASIAMILSGGSTLPTILGGAAVFGAGKVQELDENVPEMNYDKKRLIAAVNGTLEGVFETYLGSGAVARSIANTIKKQGKEVAGTEIKKSLSTVFSDMLTKNPWLTPLGEGFEEVGTQISQNIIDKYSGYRPELNIMDGIGDSFWSGVGMGGIHGTVIGLAKQATKDRGLKPPIDDFNPEQSPLNPDPQQAKEAERLNYQQEIEQKFKNVSHQDLDGTIVTALDNDGNTWYVLNGNKDDEDGLLIVTNDQGEMSSLHVSQVKDYAETDLDSEVLNAMSQYDQQNQVQEQQQPVDSFQKDGVNYTIFDETPNEFIGIDPQTNREERILKAELQNHQAFDQVNENTVESTSIKTGKNEYQATPEGDSFIINEEFQSEKDAAKVKKDIEDYLGSKVEISISKKESGNWNVPDFFVVNVIPVKPMIDENLKAEINEQVKPSYFYKNEQIDRDYALGVIEDSQTTDDLVGLTANNDSELLSLIEQKFPKEKPSYKIENKEVSRSRALSRIYSARNPEMLEELQINNDDEIEQAKKARKNELKEIEKSNNIDFNIPEITNKKLTGKTGLNDLNIRNSDVIPVNIVQQINTGQATNEDLNAYRSVLKKDVRKSVEPESKPVFEKPMEQVEEIYPTTKLTENDQSQKAFGESIENHQSVLSQTPLEQMLQKNDIKTTNQAGNQKTIAEEKNITPLERLLEESSNVENELPSSVNPEVDLAMKGAHGLKREPILDKIKRWVEELKKQTHHFEHISETEYPSVYNKLRLFEEIPYRVKKEAFNHIESIIRPIAKDKKAYEAFERYIIQNDLLNDVNNGLYTNKQLPWGYSNTNEIRQDVAQITAFINRNLLLKQVITTRRNFMNQLREQLIANNLLDEKARNSEYYFHHQVLAYMETKREKDVGVHSKDARLHEKGWQRGRVGSMKAYNTSYIEAEFEVVAQSLEQLEIKNILSMIEAEINIAPALMKTANMTGNKWKELIPEGYTTWFPKKGTNAFKAASVAEKAIQNTLTSEDANLLEKITSEVENTLWVIPEKVAHQLDSMKDNEREMIIMRGYRKVYNGWKQWVLLNPFRALKYNLNNMSGDMDIVLAYNPAILKPEYAHTAMKELWNELQGKGMSEDYKEALKHGVISSGFSVQEIPDINKQGVFKWLTSNNTNLVSKYWAHVRDYTQFRENMLRLAAYKYFKDQLNKGKNLYGVSRKDSVDALSDTNEKAGKMARELLGDYGNLSLGGQWLRSHIYPFWSWVEINAPRYYRLLKNTAYEGKSKGNTGAKITGLLAKKTAFNAARVSVQMMLLMSLVTLWNRIMHPDEDDELSKTGNRQLMLILGRRTDGSIMTVRINGALGDLLSFLGLEDATQDVEDVIKHKSTIGKKTMESGSALVNKFTQGLMPLEKTAAEMIMGKTFYPDIFNPRPIRDKGEQALRVVSIDKLYRYLTKKPLRGNFKELTSILIYDVDPGESAYYTMRQKVFDYLDTEGKERPSGSPTDRSNALFYYKQSLKYGDSNKANYWFDKYKELGGTTRGIKTSIKKGEVLSPLPANMKNKFMQTLDVEDREILDMANEWYRKIYGR